MLRHLYNNEYSEFPEYPYGGSEWPQVANESFESLHSSTFVASFDARIRFALLLNSLSWKTNETTDT